MGDPECHIVSKLCQAHLIVVGLRDVRYIYVIEQGGNHAALGNSCFDLEGAGQILSAKTDLARSVIQEAGDPACYFVRKLHVC